MNKEEYRKEIIAVVNTLEKEESLIAVHTAALIGHDIEFEEKRKMASDAGVEER